jgi:hypothetical protein
LNILIEAIMVQTAKTLFKIQFPSKTQNKIINIAEKLKEIISIIRILQIIYFERYLFLSNHKV